MIWPSAGACAQTPTEQAPPPQVQQLIQLLQDPGVRAWLEKQRQAPVQSAPEARPASQMMMENVARLKHHLASLAAALPSLPDEFDRAGRRFIEEREGRSVIAVLFLVGVFLALGAGTEWLVRQATGPLRARIGTMSTGSVPERLKLIGLRLAFRIGDLAIFTIGSVGAFLIFNWPPLLDQIVAAFLIAAVALRLVLVGGRFLLAPKVESRQEVDRFRLIPMSNEAARFWYRRIALFVGWFAFGWAVVDVLRALGFSLEARLLVAYALGLGLVVIALEAVWSRRLALRDSPEDGRSRRIAHTLGAVLMSVYIVLLWILWVLGMMRLFWLGVVALLLPAAIQVTKRAVRHALRPSEGPALASGDMGLTSVYIDRGVRALLIAGAVLFLAWAWEIDLVKMTSSDTVPMRLVKGALSSVVIILVADLIWQIVKTLIDRRLAQVAAMASPGSEEALRQARLRTLLPIFRFATFIVVAVVAGLMVLSALGVEIGPLIAGAGIVGVAVGFGSQTLVRDVISGIFYLLDDAFRVGEYIQSGNYKGTVESLGLRSVKLRHHRGPIYTVPYGQLGAVENMSRDWVIDKMTVSVTYDTDLDRAKKIIKQIGKEIEQDPELAPHIIEPLKMQGVEQFGDFAIQLRLKMMTRPGEQFPVRRKAYGLIKKAFDENGIKFAFPTVQIAGGEEVKAAAAQEGLKLAKRAPPG